MGTSELRGQYQQLEARLQTLAPQLQTCRREAAGAQNEVQHAQNHLSRIQSEYHQYISYSSYGLDEEHKQKLEAIQQELGRRMSDAQYQLRNAQSQLSAARSRLTRLEASLRALSSGYAQLQSGFAAEIRKLETAAAKVNALSGNRYGGNLESLKSQLRSQWVEMQKTSQYCAERIRQIGNALGGGSEDGTDTGYQKVKTWREGRTR